MNIELLDQGAFTSALVHLDPGDRFVSESGAMFRASSNVNIDVTTRSKSSGGFFGGVKRLLAAENFFFSTYEVNDGQPGEGLRPGPESRLHVDRPYPDDGDESTGPDLPSPEIGEHGHDGEPAVHPEGDVGADHPALDAADAARHRQQVAQHAEEEGQHEDRQRRRRAEGVERRPQGAVPGPVHLDAPRPRHAVEGYGPADMALWDSGPDGTSAPRLVAYATQLFLFSFMGP